MTYLPVNHSIEELLHKAGYSPKGAIMGWIKPTTLPNNRFHAIINRGIIDLHFDLSVGIQHKASKFSRRVVREIRRLQKLDNNPLIKIYGQ